MIRIKWTHCEIFIKINRNKKKKIKQLLQKEDLTNLNSFCILPTLLLMQTVQIKKRKKNDS